MSIQPATSTPFFPEYPPDELDALAQVSTLRNRSVLITGATGFIGSHLANALSASGVKPSLFVLDEERPLFPAGASVYRGNLADLYDCLRIVGRSNPEIIFHLAAQPLVDTALDSVIDTMESNVRGAYNLLEACRNAGKRVQAIVWISTDKVYGLQSESLKETTPLLGFDHPYDASKLCGDLLAQTYARAFELPIIIVRSGNIYGGGDLHWDRLIPGAIRSTLLGEPFHIRSNGLLKRDYIYISDILRAYLSALDGLLTGKLKKGSAINFGATRPYTVLEIVEQVLQTLGRSDLRPIIYDHARSEIPEQHVDFEQARALLGWSPQVGLEMGIQKSIEWYRQYLDVETLLERA